MRLWTWCAAMGIVLSAMLSVACGARPSSFETLGIPEVSPEATEAAIILGWAREKRGGWTIQTARINGRRRSEWNKDTQHPAVFYVRPGRSRLHLWAIPPLDRVPTSNGRRRRYRMRRVEIRLRAGQVQLCVLRLDADSGRPTVSCNAAQEQAPNRDDPPEGAPRPESRSDHEQESRGAGQPRDEAAPSPTTSGSVDGEDTAPPGVASTTTTPAGTEEEPAPRPFILPVPAGRSDELTPTERELLNWEDPAPDRPQRLSLEERIERLEQIVEALRRSGNR